MSETTIIKSTQTHPDNFEINFESVMVISTNQGIYDQVTLRDNYND